MAANVFTALAAAFAVALTFISVFDILYKQFPPHTYGRLIATFYLLRWLFIILCLLFGVGSVISGFVSVIHLSRVNYCVGGAFLGLFWALFCVAAAAPLVAAGAALAMLVIFTIAFQGEIY